MESPLPDIEARPALQQPGWDDHPLLPAVRKELSTYPPLVHGDDVERLRSALARVASGHAQVILAGDCAEDPAECTAGYVARKEGLLDDLAGILKGTTRRPVVRVGRIAGQFGKPRTCLTERHGDLEMPSYRGHMVNSPEPDPELRKPDPLRMLGGYRAAREAMLYLGWCRDRPRPESEPPVWTSHEALLLDYELPMLRASGRSRGSVLTSTHWPWIGERTRQVDGAHVAMLAAVTNPVACKIGPGVTTDELLALCERLDPWRAPGRLTLVIRMGADVVADRLPPMVERVRAAGHPVVWLCDPMHANTVTTPAGLKTRYVDTIVREVRQFQRAVRAAGGVPGGLHLETTPDEVTECVPNHFHIDRVADKYTTFCDPRLNPRQAMSVVPAWSG